MAFDAGRYQKDGKVIFQDIIDDDGELRQNATFVQALYSDGSDAYANFKNTVLSFQNVRNGKDVFFKAFITAFNETYTPNFNSTEVFGRTDPIQQYKNTTRNITLAWKLPASSESEAYENLGKVQTLLQMLYPTYLSDNTLTLSQAPLVRLKVMNLLQKNKKNSTTDANSDNGKIYKEYENMVGSGNGLLGAITSCTVNHNLEGPDGVFEKDKQGTILPKLIDINISFTPLHEQTLGYGTSDSISYFPYGVELGDGVGDGRNYDTAFGKVVRTVITGPNATSEDTRQRTPPGKSLEKLREAAKTLEEKRRDAASAQQKADKAAGAARRAQRRLGRMDTRVSENETRRTRLEDTGKAFEDLNDKAAAAAAEVTQIESLIGSNSTY